MPHLLWDTPSCRGALDGARRGALGDVNPSEQTAVVQDLTVPVDEPVLIATLWSSAELTLLAGRGRRSTRKERRRLFQTDRHQSSLPKHFIPWH